MEPYKIEKGKEITSELCIEVAKAIKIYELLLGGINFKEIPSSNIETKELNNINEFKSLIKYINKINGNQYKAKALDKFSNAYKNLIDFYINDFKDDLKNVNDLYKLSACYNLYKLQCAENIYDESIYMEKIDDKIDNIIRKKEIYYDILILLGQFKEDMFGDNKEIKVSSYFKIIFYLNENIFETLLTDFMKNKQKLYQQYNISLPSVIFDEKSEKTLRNIKNILLILEKTEKFKTNERFEYFNTFKENPELLDQINYVLFKQNKKPILALDRLTSDIGEEAIDYSLNKNVEESNDKYISELEELLKEEKKKKENMDKEFKLLQNEQALLLQKYNAFRRKYLNEINNLELKIKELRKKNVENKTINNQQQMKINSLNSELSKKDEIIERISYREVGTKIIEFFSCSLSEKQKQQNQKIGISSKNIHIISNNIKENFLNYDKYMKNKKADDPIRKFFAVASTAPSKTRGSFVAAALSTLQMFVSEYVADTIQKSDFDLRDFAKKKTAIYILLSDDKLTYHKLRKFIGTTVIYSNC